MELFDVRFGKFAVVLLDNVVYGTEMIGGFDDVVYINRFIRHSDRVGFPSIGKFDSDIISTKVVFLADIGKKYYHILHLPLCNYNFKLLGLIFQPFTTNVGSDGISLAAVSMMTVLLSPGKSEKKLSV